MATKGVIRKSLSYYVLLALEKAVDGYVKLEDFTYNPGFYVQGMREVDKSEFSQALKRLRVRGFIEQDHIDTNKVIFKLTELGRNALGLEIEEEWDGKFRIVIFDIPEQKRIIRNLFRRRLKEWGFRRWQQSVWVTKRNVTKKLKILVADLKIEDWIAVVESDDRSIGNIMMDGRTR